MSSSNPFEQFLPANPTAAAPSTPAPALATSASAAPSILQAASPESAAPVTPPASGAGTPPAASNDNPFEAFLPNGAQPKQYSGAAAAFHAAEGGVAPTLGGMAAAGAGAELGAAAGAAVGGPFAPLTGAIGGVVGGIGGFLGGSYALQNAQDWAIHQLPDSWQDALGQSEQQQRMEQQQHPIGSFVGGIIPLALTMSPFGVASKLGAGATAFQRIMANPLTSRLLGGTMMGGMELGQEKVDGQPLNWQKIGISTGFGMLFNRQNALGDRLTSMGAGLFGAPHVAPGLLPEEETEPSPTVAQAADAKVMGAGITEPVFQGAHEQAPAAQMAAQDAARTEQSLSSEPAPGPDLHTIARQMHPDLFSQYDALNQQANDLRSWIDREKNPAPDDIQAAKDKLDYATGRLQDDMNPLTGTRRPGNIARLRAFVADAQSQYDEITQRAQAWAEGRAQETPGTALARQHLMDVNAHLAAMAPDIGAAYRRAAETPGGMATQPTEAMPPGLEMEGAAGPTVAPAAETPGGMATQPTEAMPPGLEMEGAAGPTVAPQLAAEPPTPPPSTPKTAEQAAAPEPTAPAKPIEEQRQAIARDVTKKLIAAGRPAEEAESAGQLVAARYVTRAARMRGVLGSAEDIYARQGAAIRGDDGRTVKIAPKRPAPTAERAPEEVWSDFERSKTGAKTEEGFAAPGDVVKAEDDRDVLAVNEPAGGEQVVVSKPDEAGESEAFIHNPAEGTLEPIGDVDFNRVASTVRGDEPEPVFEPLPEHPDEIDAEAIRRSSAPVPDPEEVAERDIAETAPVVVVAKPERVETAKDAYADKWFWSKAKGEAFIVKRGLDATHEVVQNGKRFEIVPRKGEPAALKPAAPVEAEPPAAQESTAEPAPAAATEPPTEAPPAAAAEPAPVVDRKGREWHFVGHNEAGEELWEDQRGVHSIVRDGIRTIEPVTIDPRGGIAVNRDIHPEYQVAPEPAPAEIAPETAVEPTAPIEETSDGGVERQPGPGLRGGTREIPEGGSAGAAPKVKRIRGPRKSSPFSGESGVGDAPVDDGAGHEADAGPPLHGQGDSVTRPPASGAGAGEARPDTPASAGLKSAQTSIEERSRSNYRITDNDQIGVGTPKQKIKANIDAIRVLKTLDDEARQATPEEKAILVKYTGWGAFAQDMFSPYKTTFKEERQAFRSLVTDAEYDAARASTLNAHYTSPDVVRGMWDAMAHLGYDGGMAIEPSCGSGNFIGMIPDSVAPRTAWTGVELDPLTGRIAKHLYGGAEINIQGFETLRRPSNYYDLAISNVPFGDFRLKEKPYGSYPIHDFFFVKSLDKVRPGGVVAFVTSRFTMDKLDGSMRRELAKSADLVGAIRLPGGDKGAFAGNAGTAVTTDIIFLRKRVPGEEPFPGADWMDTKEIATPEGPAKINQYFADNPKMMLGEMRLTRGMYSEGEPTLVGDPEGLREKIAEAARTMPAGAFTKRGAPLPPTIHSTEIEGNVKEGAFFLKDGDLYRRLAGQGVAHSVSGPVKDRLTRLVGIRDLVNDLLATQISAGEGAADTAERLREKLRTAYDAFVAKHGPINKEIRTVTSRLNKAGEPIVTVRYPNLADFEKDPDAYKVAAVEKYDAESGTATRATIQNRDVISQRAERQIDSPADAVAAVLDETGRVDLQAIGNLIGAKTEDETAARLGDQVFQNPDGRAWETAGDYLSGDVVKKLEEARAIAASEPAYLRNVAALEKVQPTPLAPADITAQLGAPWIPPDAYEAFLKEIGASRATVRYVPTTSEWKIDVGGWSRDAISKFGTDRMPVDGIVDGAMNNKLVTVNDYDADGKPHVNQKETDLARAKVEALREAFTGDQDAGIDGWVWNDPARAEKLAAIYNRTFNNVVARKFDGSHQTFPGMSAELSLRPHQKDAVWRTVQSGNTLLAHVVGAGKTFTMVASAMEQRRLGLVQKPMHVVPNHMLEQFSREFLQAYPNAKILVAQKDEMKAADRKAFIAKVATNDWDSIVITHDAFSRISMGHEFRQQYVRDQLDELERVISAEAAESRGKSPTVKALEKSKKKLQVKLESLLNEERKDEGTTFEESGVDMLLVDEAHKFKNLSFITRMTRIKGLSQGNSQRAEDLFMKMRYLEQKRPGRSGVFATGTPVSNTMAELWTMMRYLELDKLKEAGLDSFDAWASTFGKIVNNTELSADGRTFKDVASFSKFVNVPELISLYSQIADTRTADMLNLPRPEVKTRSGAPGIEIVQAEPSEQEEAHINHLVELAESLKGQRPEPGKPNMLSVVSGGRKVATDGRLIDPETYRFNPNGKIAKAVENISRIYREGREPGLAQMVFLDLGVPSAKTRAKPAARARADDEDGEDGAINDGEPDPAQADVPRINLYADIKQRLIAEGIPANEIAFIHDAGDDEKKAKLFAKVRSGEVRVILGSSEKMGVGTNVQERLIAMHHLDAPWRPADVEQRDGRIVRQGNLNKQVQIYRYVTKKSFDAFMWQKLDTKSKFISQVLSGAKGSRHAEDVDNPLPEAAEMKAAASGDPRIMEHADLTRVVRQLQTQKRAFDATVARATWELKSAKGRLDQYRDTIGHAMDDAARVTDISGDKFKVRLGSQDYDSRKEAGTAIVNKISAMGTSDFYRPQDLKLGTMSGFDMRLEVQSQWGNGETYLSARASLVGDSKYSSIDPFVFNEQTDPMGLMRKFENLLPRIARQPDTIGAGMDAERKNIEKLSATLQAKWPRTEELTQAQKKLADLTASLVPKEKPAEGAEEPAAPQPAEYAQDSEPREFSQGVAQGKIRITPGRRPIITLMREANASTFIHESGHQWLVEMMSDAAHPAAPADLRQDAQTIRRWLGLRTGQTIPDRAHEKFARGFEQYLREGIAPSPGLAQVFSKFRNWLTAIYQTIKGLGKPINEDIRGVFDRMLATEPHRTIYAADRAPQPSIADIHEADAAETEPAEAEPARDRVVAEAQHYEASQPPKVANELARASQEVDRAAAGTGVQPAGENGDGSGGGAPMESGGGEPKPVAGVGDRGKQSQPVVQGGGAAGDESPGVSAAGTGSRPATKSGAEQLAPEPARLIDGPDSDLVDKDGNIRIENLTKREDIAQAIRESGAKNNYFIGDRRGVVTDGQVMDLADALGMDAQKLSKRRIGQAFNAEEVMAARMLLIKSATAVADAMKKAATGTDEDVMAYAQAKDLHQMIQAQVAGITAEAGRALRAFRNISGAEGAKNVAAFIKGATGKTLFQLREEAKLGSALDTPQQVSKFMADGTQRSFGRMILEFWINGLISGPSTHTTYAIGNTILALEKAVPETAAAALIGRARTALGRKGDTVRMGEVGAQLRGAVSGLAPAVKASATAFQRGVTTNLPREVDNPDPFVDRHGFAAPGELDETAGFHAAMGEVFGIVQGIRDGIMAGAGILKSGGIKGSPLLGARYSPTGYIPDITLRGVNVLPVGTAARLPGRFIAAIHSFFRSMNYSMAKNGEAYRAAANEGLAGQDFNARVAELRQNPTPDMMERSRENATDLTLMGQGGDFIRKFSAITNHAVKLPVLGETPILKFIDPFVRISASIMDQSLMQRTPVGLFSQAIRDDLMGRNGNVAADTAAAKILCGTALAVTFGGLAAEGLTSGSGPSDPHKSAMWRLAGNQAHSIRIGDIWYQVNRLGPLGLLSSVAADMYDVAHKASQGDMSAAGAALMNAFTQNILDEGFMSGPAELMQALTDPDRYGPAYVRNFLSSFVPYSVGMAQMARAEDPYSRNARTILEAIKAKVPGLSETLYPRRDVWGQPIPNLGAIGGRGLTAIYMQQANADPVNQAMLQLGIYPAPVDRKIRNVPLSDAQYDDFSRIAGRMTKMNLNKLVSSREWQYWPVTTRYDVVEETITQNREVARGMMLLKYPQIVVEATRMKLAKTQGAQR
jgi:N12 class adenine-specific DNA methylase